MSDFGPIGSGRFSHDLLLHDSDDEVVNGIKSFVDRGLASRGDVLVHGTADRVAMLREALGTHPRLEYGLDSELYLTPSSTIFAYQHRMAMSPEPFESWVAGTVPVADDIAGQAAWARYESVVNEVLCVYPFHGLCTYDTRTLPAHAIAAARATHPCISTGTHRTSSPDYVHPAEFLTDPLAGVPYPPDSPPVGTATLHSIQDLRRGRRLVARCGVSSSALAREALDDLIIALNEVLINALEHGTGPVQLTVWVETSKLTCRVTDAGLGIPDPLSGYRYPAPTGPKGLWVARQMCEHFFVSNPPGGGCTVLIATA